MIMRIKNLLPAVSRPAGKEDDHPFYSLQHQMNSLFDDFFSGFDVAPRSITTGELGVFSPSIDVKESDKDFIIKSR